MRCTADLSPEGTIRWGRLCVLVRPGAPSSPQPTISQSSARAQENAKRPVYTVDETGSDP
jgi:hypothetical protein